MTGLIVPERDRQATLADRYELEQGRVFLTGIQAIVRVLLVFDHLYIGGGNASAIKIDLGPNITLIDNDAGMLGGIKLWSEPQGSSRSPR